MPLHPRQGSRVTKSRHLSQLTLKDPHSPQDLQAAVGFTQGSIQHPCPAEVQIDGTEVQSLQSLAGDEGSGQVWAAGGGKLAGFQPGMEGTDLGSKLGWGDGFTHLIAHPRRILEILPGRTRGPHCATWLLLEPHKTERIPALLPDLSMVLCECPRVCPRILPRANAPHPRTSNLQLGCSKALHSICTPTSSRWFWPSFSTLSLLSWMSTEEKVLQLLALR